jgi:hypothetical protein
MSDDLEKNLQSENKPIEEVKQADSKSEESDKNQKADESNRSDTVEELIKKLTEEASSKNLNEDRQWFGASHVYIDARSGGNYFAGRVGIKGDVVGRNQSQSNKHGFSKEVAGQILTGDIEKICAVYIETNSYQQAKYLLDEKHLLILYGKQHLGKQTTGVHLLSFLESKVILEIDPTVENLSTFEAELDRVYLIDTLAVESIEKTSNYILNGLSQKLKQKIVILSLLLIVISLFFQKNLVSTFSTGVRYQALKSCLKNISNGI